MLCFYTAEKCYAVDVVVSVAVKHQEAVPQSKLFVIVYLFFGCSVNANGFKIGII